VERIYETNYFLLICNRITHQPDLAFGSDDKGIIQQLALNTTRGIFLLAIADMLYAEAEGAFNTLFMSDGCQHILPRSMKECLHKLSEYGFIKVNRTCLVNHTWILRLIPQQNKMELKSGHQLTVTRHFMKEVLSHWKVV